MEPPAEVRGSMALFDFARDRAMATKTIERQIGEQEAAAAQIEKDLSETGEWKAHEEAKEELDNAKKDALNASQAVGAARETRKETAAELRKVAAAKALRTTKKRLKALRENLAETKGEVVRALVDGKVPNPIERDPSVKVPA